MKSFSIFLLSSAPVFLSLAINQNNTKRLADELLAVEANRVYQSFNYDPFPTTVLTTIKAGDFGFKPSANAATNTLALQRISAHINKLSGGVKLVIAKGLYMVGVQTLSKGKGKGGAYVGQSLLKISNCTKPIVIYGSGATIKFAPGLRFGSFESMTGKVFRAKAGGFFDHDYISTPQNMIELNGNSAVEIKSLTLDGNIQNMEIGGYWGDTGIQLSGDGILAIDNTELKIDSVTSQFFPRDGIQVGNTTPNETAPVKKIFLRNSSFDGNVRQAFSWIGGNHLYAFNCRFINTGKTINTISKEAVQSAPSAGVDAEAELGLIRNGLFENCTIDNNAGAGLLSVGDVASITYKRGKIIGATSWSIYGTGPKAVFTDVVIVGSPVNLRSGTGPQDKDNAVFNSCLITMDSTLSPTKKVYGGYVMDFGGGAGGHFINCTIDSKNRGTVYGGGGCVFTNCTFKQGATAPAYNGYPFMRGTFYGINKWFRPGAGVMPENLSASNFYGPFYVNGVEVTGKKFN